MAHYNQLSEEQRQDIINRYIAREPPTKIAASYGIKPDHVARLYRQAGGAPRGIERKKISKEDEGEICRLYEEGFSCPEIAPKFNISESMVRKYLISNQVTMRDDEECRRKYPIRKDFFDQINSEEKAYFLGFFYADGGNNKEANMVRIDIHRQDRDILEKFAKLIYLEDPLSQVKEHTRRKVIDGVEKIYDHVYLGINSKYICHQLERLGAGPRKSLILTFPEWLIDPELQRHFIRGYYDGDGGTFVSEIKTRGASSRIVGTKQFCQSITKIVKDQIGLKFCDAYQHLNTTEDVKSIYLSGNRQVEKFLMWLYGKEPKIYLDRKYKIFKTLLAKNKDTDELTDAGTQGYPKRYMDKRNDTEGYGK